MGKPEKKGRRRGGKRRGSSGGDNTPALKKGFKAVTVGLEDVIFSRGSTRDADKFAESVSILSWYVSTKSWSQSTDAVKAMIELRAPQLAEPVRPVRKYVMKTYQGAVKTKEKFNAKGELNAPLLDNINHNMDLDVHIIDKKKFMADAGAWKENSARIYNLVLQNCPKDLDTEIRIHMKWSAAELGQDVIALLLMIWDVTMNLKETKQGTMAIVECGVEIYTTAQGKPESIDDYYKVFSARKDTVNAHDRRAGYQKGLCEQNVQVSLDDKGIRKDAFIAKTPEEHADLKKPGRESSCEALLAILFFADGGRRLLQAAKDAAKKKQSSRQTELTKDRHGKHEYDSGFFLRWGARQAATETTTCSINKTMTSLVWLSSRRTIDMNGRRPSSATVAGEGDTSFTNAIRRRPRRRRRYFPSRSRVNSRGTEGRLHQVAPLMLSSKIPRRNW